MAKVRVSSDTETCMFCSACGEKAFLREIGMAHNGILQRVAYETHFESIISAEHLAAQIRAADFYEKIAALVAEFKALPEEERIVRASNGGAGLLTALDIGSKRPAACEVRTIMQPFFSLRTFGKEHEIPLPERDLRDANLESLLGEVRGLAITFIEEAKDRATSGL